MVKHKKPLYTGNPTHGVNLIGVINMYIRDAENPDEVVVEAIIDEYGQPRIVIHSGWFREE